MVPVGLLQILWVVLAIHFMMRWHLPGCFNMDALLSSFLLIYPCVDFCSPVLTPFTVLSPSPHFNQICNMLSYLQFTFILGVLILDIHSSFSVYTYWVMWSFYCFLSNHWITCNSLHRPLHNSTGWLLARFQCFVAPYFNISLGCPLCDAKYTHRVLDA